jgi:hypothetical protein
MKINLLEGRGFPGFPTYEFLPENGVKRFPLFPAKERKET